MSEHLGRRPARRLLALIFTEIRRQPPGVRRHLAEHLERSLAYRVTVDNVRASVAGYPLVDDDIAAILEQPPGAEAN